MDPLKSFEKKLLSGNLIDTSKLKQNRPPWLDPSRIPRVYEDLEALVTIPGGADAKTNLDTGKVYQVLLASGLHQQTLASIWDQCSKSVAGSLVQHEFYQALALVALSQAGIPPNVQLLKNLQSAPIPQLAIAGYPSPPPGQQLVQTSSSEDSIPSQEKPQNPSSQTGPANGQIPSQETSSQACLKSQPSFQETSTTQYQNPLSETIEPFLKPSPQTSCDPHHATSKPSNGLSNSTSFQSDDEDDFADFQSAPSETFSASPKHKTELVEERTSISDRISVPECSTNMKKSIPTQSLSDRRETTKQHINQSFPSQKSPRSEVKSTTLPKQTSFLPSASLFDCITLPVTETVQPPTENNPWLGFSTEVPQSLKQAKKTSKIIEADFVATTVTIPNPESTTEVPSKQSNDRTKNPDEDFDDFDDFQSAPVNDSDPRSSTLETSPPSNLESQDKYSVFRLMEDTTEEQDSDNKLVQLPEHPIQLPTNSTSQLYSNPSGSNSKPAPEKPPAVNGSTDILSLIKLPSIPAIDMDGDLSQFDSLSLVSKDETSGSALLELQDLNVGFTAVDGPVASHPSSVGVSPAKSVASGQSIGESRGGENRLSIFTSKTNYSECAYLTGFELGPSTENSESSPSKGSVVSLELNSRSPPEDDDEVIDWTLDESGPQQNVKELQRTPDRSSSSQTEAAAQRNGKLRKNSDEFCWAQPPMFPPPDPTESEKSSQFLNTNLFLQNFPETQKKKVSREQVGEGWQRILSKAAAILESACVILGDDPLVLGGILSTAKGQAYISCLLEVYNVTQQLKKSAELHGIEGLNSHVQQVDNLWRGKLDDLATRLHLSVLCMDHLSSPLSSNEDTCAICLLPLNLRPPQILFGDNGYHSSCANFWANVLAEGLPCLKLSLMTESP